MRSRRNTASDCESPYPGEGTSKICSLVDSERASCRHLESFSPPTPCGRFRITSPRSFTTFRGKSASVYRRGNSVDTPTRARSDQMEPECHQMSRRRADQEAPDLPSAPGIFDKRCARMRSIRGVSRVTQHTDLWKRRKSIRFERRFALLDSPRKWTYARPLGQYRGERTLSVLYRSTDRRDPSTGLETGAERLPCGY